MSMTDYRTIVVGTDGSSLADATVARAGWLAKHDDAELVIVCATTLLSRRDEARNTASLGDVRQGEVHGKAAASEAIAAAVATAQDQGATIGAALVLEGEPATALLQTARDRAADLIVIGAIRDISIAERLLGTVAKEVVRRAHCDVLIVRPTEEGAAVPVPESAS